MSPRLALYICVFVASALLTSCVSTTPVVEKDPLSGASTITMKPSLLYNPKGMMRDVSIGAKWSSSAPDSAALHFVHRDASQRAYLSYKSLALSLDGTSVDYALGDLPRYALAHSAVVLPLDSVRQMVADGSVFLRIGTDERVSEYIDVGFSTPDRIGVMSTARANMKEFLALVDAARKK